MAVPSQARVNEYFKYDPETGHLYLKRATSIGIFSVMLRAPYQAHRETCRESE